MKFTEDLPPESVDESFKQYNESHGEKWLLAYVYDEMLNTGLTEIEEEQSKVWTRRSGQQ